MTDHSILSPGLPDFPFRQEAQLITRVFKYITITVPSALRAATDTHNLVKLLNNLNDHQLAGLGLERTDIAAYAATKTGLLG